MLWVLFLCCAFCFYVVDFVFVLPRFALVLWVLFLCCEICFCVVGFVFVLCVLLLCFVFVLGVLFSCFVHIGHRREAKRPFAWNHNNAALVKTSVHAHCNPFSRLLYQNASLL